MSGTTFVNKHQRFEYLYLNYLVVATNVRRSIARNSITIVVLQLYLKFSYNNVTFKYQNELNILLILSQSEHPLSIAGHVRKSGGTVKSV